MSDTNLSAVLYGKCDLRLVTKLQKEIKMFVEKHCGSENLVDCFCFLQYPRYVNVARYINLHFQEERPIPKPGYGEVQISTQKVGICGSDVSLWYTGSKGPWQIQNPILLGHEVSGVVSEVGEGVTNLTVGDRVAVDPHLPCRVCSFCKSGRYNICSDLKFMTLPPDDGALTRFFVHAADSTFKIPDTISFEEGACIEPLSVPLHACRRANVTLGDKVLITGSGPIGICTLIIAKALGAYSICMTDINQNRVDFAKKMGATYTILIREDEKEEDVISRLVKQIGGPPDKTIECSGASSALSFAVNATKQGGIVALVGLGPATAPFPKVAAIVKEIQVIGSCRHTNTWPTLIDMISTGKMDVKPMITHRFTLEEIHKAFEFAKRCQGGKVIIDCARH